MSSAGKINRQFGCTVEKNTSKVRTWSAGVGKAGIRTSLRMAGHSGQQLQDQKRSGLHFNHGILLSSIQRPESVKIGCGEH